MKVTIKETGKEDLEFPKLMISTDKKILIVASGIIKGRIKGVAINNDAWPIGHCSDSWSIIFFEDFNGSITLENE